MTPIGPDFAAVTGSGFGEVVGALLTYTLLTAVATLIGSGLTWAVAASLGSWQIVAKARTGVLVALGGAVLAGGTLAWGGWLLDLGNQL
ncbi:DUF6112 family protein [Myceligenerans crystallogenes]|uniref:Uncharacterized protein n=1 Tax=Myceligenerans crystallogenes TaxID=316335 RepID=A0ABP5A1M5_9MICO